MLSIAKLRQRLYHNELRRRGVTLGEGAYVARGSQITAAASIGDYTQINGPARLVGLAPISVGKYCAIGTGVTMVSDNHDMRTPNIQVTLSLSLGIEDPRIPDPISVRNSVWIGDHVILLPGVTVEDGAVIGAGSIVTKDIPAFGIAVGAPARVIRSRFSPEVIEFLLELEWWEWERERIERNTELLATDLTASSHKTLGQLVRA